MSSREDDLPAEKDSPSDLFPKAYRLRKSSEFKSVFRSGRKIITDTLVFHILKTDSESARLGLAVSKKVGNAVKRNHVKRRIREAFRLKRTELPFCFDMVVYPRKGVLEKEFTDYVRSFDALIARVEKKKHR